MQALFPYGERGRRKVGVCETPYGNTAQAGRSFSGKIRGCAALRAKVEMDFAPAIGAVDIGLADALAPHVFLQEVGARMDDRARAALAGTAMANVVKLRFPRSDGSERTT